MTRTIVGHFARGNEAQKALDRLQEAGFSSSDVSYVAHDGTGLGALSDSGVPEKDGAVAQGGVLVIVRAAQDTEARARQALEAAGARDVRQHSTEVQSSGVDPSDAHADLGNYGDEGGSSQWSQTVLRVGDDGESEVAKRTFGRFGKNPERLD